MLENGKRQALEIKRADVLLPYGPHERKIENKEYYAKEEDIKSLELN